MHASRPNLRTNRPCQAATRAVVLLCASVILAGALAPISGCYRRVVKAKGLGADSVTVQESYQESSKLDDWLFGPEPTRSRSTPLNR
ncbi:MAG: hypothetical protein KF768_07450 [Phycisphaeraceae bacterium]|nr:hypothetical protein [Phycisphaeraceae bacterium]